MDKTESADQAIKTLNEIVDDLKDELLHSNVIQKKEQLQSINKSIQDLDKKNIQVPEEMKSLKVKLILEIENAEKSSNLIIDIHHELMDIINKIPIRRKRKKRKRIIESFAKEEKKYKNPKILIIDNNKYPVSKWNEVLVISANWIIENNGELPIRRRYGKNLLVSDTANELYAPKKLNNGYFIATKYPRKQTVALAARLLRDCGFSVPFYVETEDGDRIR